MAILPTRIVEIEFDAGTWTDVTADHGSFATRRGRNRELGAFETGQLTLTLRNDARKYDPDNTAGTYYGKLRPNRRVRVRATYNAVTYPVFLGYIDRIAQVPGGPNDATAEITASDAFKLLNRVDLPSSVYAAEVAADAPVHWWRFGDPVGSTVAVDAGSTPINGTYNGTVALGTTGLTVRDSDTAVTFTAGAGNVEIPAASPTGATVTVEFWLNRGTISGSQTIFTTNVVGNPFAATIDGSGGVTFFLGAAFQGAGNIPAATTTHLAAVASGGTLSVYVNGALYGSTGGVGSAWSSGTIYVNGPGFGGYAGILDEFAIYNTALSAARIAAHNSAGRTPWNGDLPGTRLGRILDLAAVPTADRNIDAGTTTLQNTSLGGTALAYAQKVEETELGELFVARDGKVRFIGRQAAVTGTYLTSQATITDADAGAGLGYRATSGDVDEAIMITRATVSRDGSVAVVYFDAAAKAEFGWLDAAHDGLLHNTDAYSLQYAQWLVNTHKAPSSRVGTVTLELAGDPTNLYPGILALEIGDRITYKRKPQNVGATQTVDMRVEAISHAAGAGYWTTSLQLTPFDLVAGLPVFVWDVTKWDQHVWGL